MIPTRFSQLRAGALSGLTVLLSLCPAFAAIQLEQVLTGLSSPVYVTSALDGTNRLFIVEQAGIVKVLQPQAATPTVFLNIVSKVLFGGERGLLGLAFHPNYRTNRRFFVNYTRQTDGATVIAEYRASVSNPHVADTQEIVFLVIPQPFSNHNGGMIEFGQDGFLYIGMGDGGSANDPGNRAQTVNDLVDALLGKMLRINVDIPNGAIPYSSPPDNPFFGATLGRDEIYAVGLRNPFRWSFDRLTGLLFAGDVGQGLREEIDIISKGGNYGWRVFEGTTCTGLGPAPCNPSNYVAPIAEYDHTSGRCSIIGGYLYRGSVATLPAGTYVYGDFCTGEIFQLFPPMSGGAQTLLLDTALSISSFGEDEAGEIYVVGLGGTVHRITNTSSPPPQPPPMSGGGDGGGGGCFIATAAFGSALAAEVQVLREFRDRSLLTHAPGQLIIATYYWLSPPLARVIGRSEALRSVIRAALWPVVWWARVALVSPALAWSVLAIGTGCVLAGAMVPFVGWRNRPLPTKVKGAVGSVYKIVRPGSL